MTDPRAMPLLAGRYRAVERLGEGGMGVVWRAHDEMLHREVAVKEVRLSPHLPQAQREEMRERTMREARAAARLGHPGIVAVHDVVAQDDRPWIVMDLVRGRSLDQAVKQDGPLPPSRVAMIGLAVLDALVLAHRHGIMHRDVKPANIMIAHDGTVLLTDFGIATMEDDPALTSEGLVGSPGYIAPERLRGTEDGPAADLWSLGATLYTAVEGRAPFHRPMPVAILGAVLTQPAPPPQRAGYLGPVLLAMLEKNPRDRPGVAELRAALQQVSRGMPPAPPAPPVATEPVGRPDRRRVPVPALALGAVAVVGVAAGAFVLLGGRQPDPAPRPAPSAAAPAAGRFPTAPAPCELLTIGQVRSLVPGAAAGTGTGTDEKSCVWGDDRQVRLEINRFDPAGRRSGPEVAQEFLLSARSTTQADAGTGLVGTVRPLQNVTGVGKDSFSYDSTNKVLENASTTITFRSSNLLVEVYYAEPGRRLTPRIRQNALKAARLVSEELNSRD
ncbi:hypothetical protein Misp01_03820 [Microtetraspora sp. NBRC 13810]|uniref:serine/threonine-protein kinase n=1 Tax=Microtetraspora sp. NBRC 13810 TaxID=3030990 RepID=UPI00249FFA6F|nr:serine/threonine-protein kinase [Microtetraspora sp. NBRC 13810]GLW05252.1 hypothetical protein Misp01_03820 [Microtetraspora sp. NBRC 13810]